MRASSGMREERRTIVSPHARRRILRGREWRSFGITFRVSRRVSRRLEGSKSVPRFQIGPRRFRSISFRSRSTARGALLTWHREVPWEVRDLRGAQGELSALLLSARHPRGAREQPEHIVSRNRHWLPFRGFSEGDLNARPTLGADGAPTRALRTEDGENLTRARCASNARA
jgi:hypothetical protein